MATGSKGLVQVYTGDGKGKTTAALGQAARAVGHGWRVIFIQFLKGEPSGEHLLISRRPLFRIAQSPVSTFSGSAEEIGREARRSLVLAREQLLSGKYDLVILDEIFVALSQGHITIEPVLELVREKPGPVELVLTGRGAPAEVLRQADLVTEMRPVKHPFQRGITARRGIEY